MLTVENVSAWLLAFAEKLKEHQVYLSELDTAIGDGDHGNNMARGAKIMEEKLTSQTFNSVENIFKTAAMALLSSVGGAAGPLYGSAFLSMGKQAAADTNDVAAVVKAGLEGIQKRGRAEAGDKTMVDVWIPVTKALEEGALTKELIEEAVLSTKDMKAKKGRASYLGDRSIGHIDPGATSSGYFFESLLESGILKE